MKLETAIGTIESRQVDHEVRLALLERGWYVQTTPCAPMGDKISDYVRKIRDDICCNYCYVRIRGVVCESWTLAATFTGVWVPTLLLFGLWLEAKAIAA